MVKEAKVEDLIPDDQNMNKGNEFGESLIEKSFQQFGAGRSILLDKNNKIIAGNKSLQKFSDGGNQKVLIVETTGDTLVAVKRTDIDLDTKIGREFAIADNASAKANIEWDFPVLEAIAADFEIEPMDWGINMQNSETETAKGKMTDKFLVPPFSVLDTRKDYWQQRKRFWLSLGIKSEIGRGGQLSLANNAQYQEADGAQNLSRSYKSQKSLNAIMKQK